LQQTSGAKHLPDCEAKQSKIEELRIKQCGAAMMNGSERETA
jgi:hypothetical protein